MKQAAKRWRAAASTRLPLELIGYTLVSALALSVDWSLFVLLTACCGLHYLISAAVGFTAGLAIAYGLSVALVFQVRRYTDPRVEFAVFFCVGVAGLVLTQALLYVFVTLVDLPYGVAKLPTAGIVFIFNFSVRRACLFSKARGKTQPVTIMRAVS